MKLLSLLLVLSSLCFGQVESPEINAINKRIDSLDNAKVALTGKLETLKLNWIQDQIEKIG